MGYIRSSFPCPSLLHIPQSPPLALGRYGTDMTLAFGIVPKKGLWTVDSGMGRGGATIPQSLTSKQGQSTGRNVCLLAWQSVTMEERRGRSSPNRLPGEVTSQLKLQVVSWGSHVRQL